MWEVPYFSFERRFRRFSTLPERRMITSCSYVFELIVTAPNSLASIRIVFSRIASERRRFVGFGRGPQDLQRMNSVAMIFSVSPWTEFFLELAEYSFLPLATRRGPAYGGRSGRNEGCEFHRLAFVGPGFPRNAPAVVGRSLARQAGSCALWGARPVPAVQAIAQVCAAPIATPCRRHAGLRYAAFRRAS